MENKKYYYRTEKEYSMFVDGKFNPHSPGKFNFLTGHTDRLPKNHKKLIPTIEIMQ